MGRRRCRSRTLVDDAYSRRTSHAESTASAANAKALSGRHWRAAVAEPPSCRAARTACSTASSHEGRLPEALQKAHFSWKCVEVTQRFPEVSESAVRTGRPPPTIPVPAQLSAAHLVPVRFKQMRVHFVKQAGHSRSWPQCDAGLVLGSARRNDMELIANGPLGRPDRHHVSHLYANAYQAPPVKAGKGAQPGTRQCAMLNTARGHSGLQGSIL